MADWRVIPSPDLAASIARMAPVEAYACDGSTAADLAAGCLVLDVLGPDGTPAASLAVERLTEAHGLVTGLAGALAFVAAHAALLSYLAGLGITYLAAYTRRPGMHRRLVRLGWHSRRDAGAWYLWRPV